ncbi:MAG: hypothetical protein KIT22_16340 [Verrucomicrobiae bacterium]|nr:hypothetical protein [Verrucomicrobiae bacterium]
MKAIQRAGYVTFIALLALCYWLSHRIEAGDAPEFWSDRAAFLVSAICVLTFFAAVATAVFIAIRAFYLGLTQPDSGEEREYKG